MTVVAVTQQHHRGRAALGTSGAQPRAVVTFWSARTAHVVPKQVRCCTTRPVQQNLTRFPRTVSFSQQRRLPRRRILLAGGIGGGWLFGAAQLRGQLMFPLVGVRCVQDHSAVDVCRDVRHFAGVCPLLAAAYRFILFVFFCAV